MGHSSFLDMASARSWRATWKQRSPSGTVGVTGLRTTFFLIVGGGDGGNGGSANGGSDVSPAPPAGVRAGGIKLGDSKVGDDMVGDSKLVVKSGVGINTLDNVVASGEIAKEAVVEGADVAVAFTIGMFLPIPWSKK